MRSSPVLRSSALYAGTEVLSRVALIGALALWVRYLTVAEFGVLELLRSGILVLATPIGLGLSAAAGRWQITLDADDFRRFLGTSITAIVALGCLTIAAIALSPSAWWGQSADGLSWRTGWLLATVGALAVAVQAPLRSTLVVAGRAGAHALVVVAQAVACVGLGTLGLHLADNGVMGLLAGYSAGAAVVVGLAVWLTRDTLTLRFDPRWLRAGLLFGVPLIPHLLAHHIMVYADRAVLMKFSGATETGVYSSAYLVASGVTIACLALNKASLARVYGTMARVIAGKTANADADAIDASKAAEQRLGDIFTMWLALVCALATSATLVGPDVLQTIMPARFASASALVPMLVWGTALHGMYLIPVNTLLFVKKTRLISTISIGAAIANLVLNWLWVPRFGALGAALATIGAYALLSACVWAVAQHRVGGASARTWAERAAILGVSLAISAGFWTALGEGINPWVRLAVGSVIALAASAWAAWRYALPILRPAPAP